MAEAEASGVGRQQVERSLQRTIVSPEGVSLSVTLASRGDRAVAFALDVFFIVMAVVAVFLILWMFSSFTDAGRILWSFLLIMLFLLRNFYFTFFEIRWAGRTPGKRLVGTKVIDRRGGPLGADAVIARNLTREIEIFLPLAFLAGGGGLLDNAYAQAAAIIWVGVFALMPLFNRDNLRVGDMVGGTWVVVAPKVMLLGDLVDHIGGEQPDAPEQYVLGQKLPAAAPRTHTFSEAQLEVYGVYELQTLEEVLRRPEGKETDALIEEVANRIKAKIGWDAAASSAAPKAFLQDFYVALRQHLEGRMLFGKRREHKDDA